MQFVLNILILEQNRPGGMPWQCASLKYFVGYHAIYSMRYQLNSLAITARNPLSVSNSEHNGERAEGRVVYIMT